MNILKDLDNHAFNPTTCLNDWLLTGKKSFQPGGESFPGLFRTDNHIYHRNLVFIALIIEILGILFLSLPQFGDLGLIGGIIGGLGFIMDFGIALLLVRYNRTICYFENFKILFSDPENKQATSKISGVVNKLKGYKSIGHILILVVAALKFYFLWEGYGILEFIVYVFGFLFLCAALIHINITDYFFGYFLRFKRKANRDKENHNITLSNAIPQEIFTPQPLVNFSEKNYPFQIIASGKEDFYSLPEGNMQKRYKSQLIYPEGTILTDKDLEKLCNHQQDIAKKGLARQLLLFQLRKVTPDRNYLQLNTDLNNILQ